MGTVFIDQLSNCSIFDKSCHGRVIPTPNDNYYGTTATTAKFKYNKVIVNNIVVSAGDQGSYLFVECSYDLGHGNVFI